MNVKIAELDGRKQELLARIAELTVEAISPEQVSQISGYLDTWDNFFYPSISQEVEIMHEKEIEKLQAEKEKVERQLAQEKHKIQRLENRAAYYEKGERRKRAHRLITRGAAIESVAPQTKELGETGFYALAEQVFALPDAQRLLMEAVSRHAGGD